MREEENRQTQELEFSELLRHELNNPLTGILGNAELLLMEMRRKNLGLPAHFAERLETIAALAVRTRETVRRLSEECPEHMVQATSGGAAGRQAYR